MLELLLMLLGKLVTIGFETVKSPPRNWAASLRCCWDRYVEYTTHFFAVALVVFHSGGGLQSVRRISYLTLYRLSAASAAYADFQGRYFVVSFSRFLLACFLPWNFRSLLLLPFRVVEYLHIYTKMAAYKTITTWERAAQDFETHASRNENANKRNVGKERARAAGPILIVVNRRPAVKLSSKHVRVYAIARSVFPL